MDNTLADYLGMAKLLSVDPNKAKSIPGFFRNLHPMPGAIESFNLLFKYFDVYILTYAPWSNPQAYVEKIEWVKEYLPIAEKRIIFSHYKNLNKGDYLIDDSSLNNAEKFEGDIIHIHTSDKFPNWESVIQYIFDKENIKL